MKTVVLRRVCAVSVRRAVKRLRTSESVADNMVCCAAMAVLLSATNIIALAVSVTALALALKHSNDVTKEN